MVLNNFGKTGWNSSGKIRPAQFPAVLCPRNSRAGKNLVFRKRPSSPARLRWVLEYSKHRRTATRQRGLCSSLPKQLPLDRSQTGIPGENSSLKVVREGASLRAPALSTE